RRRELAAHPLLRHRAITAHLHRNHERGARAAHAPDRAQPRRSLAPLLAALAFLTRLPVPAASRGRFESGVAWVPAVGLMLGAILAATDLGLRAVRVSLPGHSAPLVVLLRGPRGARRGDGLAHAWT